MKKVMLNMIDTNIFGKIISVFIAAHPKNLMIEIKN